MVTYYQKNKERLKEYQREYYYKNREKILEYKKCGTKAEKPKTPKKKDNPEQEYDIISSRVEQMEMLNKWNGELEEKLTNENLTNFSRWACELNLRENKKTIDEMTDESENLFWLGNRNEVIDQLLIFVKKECENTWRTQPPQVVKLKRQFLKQLADKIKSYRT
jgi:hypothetical protein